MLRDAFSVGVSIAARILKRPHLGLFCLLGVEYAVPQRRCGRADHGDKGRARERYGSALEAVTQVPAAALDSSANAPTIRPRRRWRRQRPRCRRSW